mgnify:CR=1 FL=1
MSFWDTEPAKPEFVFEDEKRKLIENMDYLMTMSVEEQTLYKKWVELQESNMIRDKSQIATLYDMQWKPTDINNKELTIKEIEELEPYVEIRELLEGSSFVAKKAKTFDEEKNVASFSSKKSFSKRGILDF